MGTAEARATSEQPGGAIERIAAVDRALGLLEQALLALSLLLLVGMGGYQTLATRLLDSKATWPNELIRYSVFFIATLGAALAAQQMRMFAMGAVGKLLPGKAQALVRIVIALFVLAAVYVLAVGGLDAREHIRADRYEVISPTLAVLALPLSCALIGLHYFLHALMDLVYLAKGQTPPPQEGVSAH